MLLGLFPSKGFFFIICNSKGLDQVTGKAFFFNHTVTLAYFVGSNKSLQVKEFVNGKYHA